MKHVIIAGSRGFNNYLLLVKELDLILPEFGDEVTIVSGGARGADTLGERYAQERNLPIHRYPADWNAYGRRAGLLRNAQMVEESDGLVAFWDGTSRGTKHTIQLSEDAGLLTYIRRFK